MRIVQLNKKTDYLSFFKVGKEVYKNSPCFKATDNDIIKLLIEGPTHFHTHAQVTPFLIYKDFDIVGRFAFIYDKRLMYYAQVAFFEAFDGLEDVDQLLISEAKIRYPECKKICIGLNGHLNYSAGFLQNNFDEVPVFGLPYSQPYYLKYFKNLHKRKIVSFRFSTKNASSYINKLKNTRFGENISVRKLDRNNIAVDTLIYTYLNNLCFQKHPYWSDRDGIEDLELFEPFKNLLRDENLIFAEYNGKVVGFLLWFPDFNQLVRKQRELRAGKSYSYDVLRYRFFNPIQRFRFTEIAVDPEYRKKGIELALINQMIIDVAKTRYKFGEGGFIFEENLDSVNLTIRYIERFTGETIQPHNRYVVYEANL
ncbi:MAG: GNAT family N-acetyltransferase [Bacteroidota bacterium]